MKVTRQKHARRILKFFKLKFQIHEPYQILVDKDFCQAALDGRIYIQDQMSSYLDGRIVLQTTPCITNEMKTEGERGMGAYLVAKNYEHRKCGHKKPLSSKECINQLVAESGNPYKLFVATQDPYLRKILRRVPCVPILYINYNCIILEQPSETSEKAAEKIESNKLLPNLKEQALLERLQKESLPIHRHKRAKAPNPLSTKKGSKRVQTDGKMQKSRVEGSDHSDNSDSDSASNSSSNSDSGSDSSSDEDDRRKSRNSSENLSKSKKKKLRKYKKLELLYGPKKTVQNPPKAKPVLFSKYSSEKDGQQITQNTQNTHSLNGYSLTEVSSISEISVTSSKRPLNDQNEEAKNSSTNMEASGKRKRVRRFRERKSSSALNADEEIDEDESDK